jgi:hypothetical protein
MQLHAVSKEIPPKTVHHHLRIHVDYHKANFKIHINFIHIVQLIINNVVYSNRKE